MAHSRICAFLADIRYTIGPQSRSSRYLRTFRAATPATLAKGNRMRYDPGSYMMSQVHAVPRTVPLRDMHLCVCV
jgi:hypothetical protein